MYPVPERFARTILEVNGEEGCAWLDRLPEILDACARQWTLTIGPPSPHLSYNYVAPAVRAGGMAVILKACPPGGEFAPQAAALQVYGGRGAARLVEADPRARCCCWNAWNQAGCSAPWKTMWWLPLSPPASCGSYGGRPRLTMGCPRWLTGARASPVCDGGTMGAAAPYLRRCWMRRNGSLPRLPRPPPRR